MGENRKNSILIVDDEKSNLDLLVDVLSPDYTVYLTKSGASSIEMAKKLLPDLILLDIVMPDMDGYEVLQALKSSETTQDIPIVFITGLSGIKDEEKGLALQAADYIHKPLNPVIVKLRVGNQIQIVNQIRAIKEYAHEVAASEERSKFFARMSHEMRTPLNAVIGLSETTLDEFPLCDDARDNIAKVCNAGTSLLHMVNDILDISKIEVGKFSLVPVEYDFPGMLNDTITQSMVYKGDKPINFILNIDERIPLNLFGDDQRIKQVLNNFLSNAFKYTMEGTVELKAQAESVYETVWLTFTVRDTGIGIPEEDVDKLFTDYTRMNTDANRKIAGTGLGLSITKMLVDMMGGNISVQSEYGRGSSFNVRFPQRSVSSEVLGPEIVKSLVNFHYAAGKHRNRPKLVRASLPYARVLVVDDTVYNLDVARAMLKPYKMNVDCVTSGKIAVDAIRNDRVKYNAVFMDQMMPEMDGFEATRIIREEIGTDYAKNVPIIAFTANALSGNEAIFLGKGFQAFITKPVDVKRLDAVINQWVRNEEQEKLYKESIINEGAEGGQDSFDGNNRRSGLNRRKSNDRRLFAEKIKGVNTSKVLDRFSGDREAFLQILQSFCGNTRKLLETLKDVNADNLATYAINVHGIKSSCRGVCAEETGLQAENLEHAAKDGNLDYVLENNQALVDNVHELIENIEAALDRMNQGKGNPAKDKPRKDKPYQEALDKLRIACDEYKIEDIEKLMNEIECYEYTEDGGLALWLRENVDQMNYAEIVERLAGSQSGEI